MRAAAVLVGMLVMAVAACTPNDSMPQSFNGMATGEVGCTVTYGDDPLYIVGPLGTSDSENVEPNDYTLIRLGRTASDLVLAAEGPDWESHASTPLNEITTDGVAVMNQPFRGGGDPGYVVTCWRGDS